MSQTPIPSSFQSPRRANLRRSLATASMLALAVGFCLPAQAQNAVMVLPDICDDPAGVFDYQWVKQKFGAQGLYVMQAGGGVDRIEGEQNRSFSDYRYLYVAAHGGDRSIGGMSYGGFVDAFKQAHPDDPYSVSFAVCSAAKGPDSLLKMMSTKYGDRVVRLSGGVTACALTGNGDPDLANADYRIHVQQSDPHRYDTIIDNITAKWAAPYPGSQANYRAYCRSKLQPFSADGMRGFIETVYREFSTSPDPAQSTNYLELVALNKDGEPLTVCGADPAGKGPVPCP